MPEQYSKHEKDFEPDALEERFNAYYGPALPEQPLPASSWSHLSARLTPRRRSKRWLRPGWRFMQQRGSQALPLNIEERLAYIAFQSNMLGVALSIRSTFKPRIDIPFVSVSLFKRHEIRLLLPLQGGLSLSQAELDVLLASGIAHYKYKHQLSNAVTQILLSISLFLPMFAVVLILVSWRNILTPVALSLIGSLCLLSIVFFLLLSYQARRTARKVDKLIVQWLGREQTCRGLHALAARSQAPTRKRWGELSLDERIHTICHTPVAIEDERFTLVR